MCVCERAGMLVCVYICVSVCMSVCVECICACFVCVYVFDCVLQEDFLHFAYYFLTAK